MRLSNSRYDRDRTAFDVAAKLIEFEVRTTTITQLTGLSATRVRILYRACGVGMGNPAVRHRGKPPRSTEILLGKPAARTEAACLLALCKLMGVETHGVRATHFDLAHSERLCEIFETYRAMIPNVRFTFEQLLLVLASTAEGFALKTASCPHCRALVTLDPLDLADPICFHCDTAVALQVPGAQVRPLRVADGSGRYRVRRREVNLTEAPVEH